MEELKITRERAIKRMEWILKHEIYCSDKLSHAAINMAITALRSAEPENKPLTAQWISAKDKLPEIGQRVVVKCNELYHGMFDVLCYYPDYKPWKNDGVAYWLPLPELPENTRKNRKKAKRHENINQHW